MDYVSKVAKLNRNVGALYTLFADFRLFANLIPRDKVQDFEATEDECSFSIKPIGKTGLRIVDREPEKVVKYAPNGKTPTAFFLWVQFKPAAPYETYMRITFRAELNFIMRKMLGDKIKKGLDNFLDQLAASVNG